MIIVLFLYFLFLLTRAQYNSSNLTEGFTQNYIQSSSARISTRRSTTIQNGNDSLGLSTTTRPNDDLSEEWIRDRTISLLRLLGKASGVVVQEPTDPYQRSEELSLIRTAALAAAIHGQINPSDDPYLSNLDATVEVDVYRAGIISPAMKSHRLYYLHLAQTLTKLSQDGIKVHFDDLRQKEKDLRSLETTGHIFRYCKVLERNSLRPECR